MSGLPLKIPQLDLRRYLSRRIHVWPAEEVTTRSPQEVPAQDVGLDPAIIEAIWHAVVRYYQMGLHPAISICIRRGGAVVLDRAIGHARGNGPADCGDPVLATPDTPFNLFSGSKAVLAMLIHLLEERGQLSIDDPVVDYIPGFGRHGKEGITVRHLLCHQAGLPATPPAAIDLDVLNDRERLLELICDARPEMPPGRVVAYHAVNSGFVLGEIAHRVSGMNVRALLDEAIRTPLGFKWLSYGVAAEHVGRVARESITGPRAPKLLSRMLERSLGVDFEDVIGLTNDPRFVTGIVPPGNVYGTANEVSRYFELLLRGGELDGVRIFDERTVARAIAAQNRAYRVDRTIRLPIRYGLGFMLGHERLSFYGPNTAAAFGHLGFTNVLAWADPERDISVAFMNNGKPFVTPELVFWLNIARVIARRVPRDHSAAARSQNLRYPRRRRRHLIHRFRDVPQMVSASPSTP